ncbi:MAG TPA: S9 family peptidase [Thermoanaerobaculia bacterium]
MTNFAIPFELRQPDRPPRPARIPRILSVHGEKLIDDYAWLRDRNNPEVLAHLEAEDAWADAVMQPTERLQQALYEEMRGRIRETDANVPWRMGSWEYVSRTVEGKQYEIISRRRGEGSPEEILLDLNELAEGKEYLSLGDLEVSDDGNFLAYSIDETGSREYTLFIKDLRTGRLLPDRIGRVTSIAWGADGQTLFYVAEDDAKRPYRLLRHRIGRRLDETLYEERDALFRLWVARSRSGEYLFATAASATTTEVRYMRADGGAGAFRVLEPRADGHEYYVEHGRDRFWIITNDRGRNFRLANTPVSHTAREQWSEVIAHREDVKVEEIEIFERHLVVFEREGLVDRLLVIDLESGERHRVAFAEPVYAVSAGSNRVFDTSRIRLVYESYVTPPTVYDYDMERRASIPLKRTEVRGGYDPAEYVTERLEATAADGTAVPISLVRRRDLGPGPHPLVLYGYGAYGSPSQATFSSNRLSLLDRGIVFATAHVRGGGDMGEAWHEQGKMAAKRNTFSDFIACAEALIAAGYTSPQTLVATGGSAGGLLVGAVLNMRPDLFRAAVALVPFVDVVNTMLDPSLPLTVGEYLEWGDPSIEEQYRWMRGYDPYYGIEAKEYPALLVRTALNDTQVMYWEAAKYVARLRAKKTDDNPLLLKIDMGAGHGGASGRYDRLREDAFDYAFILTRLGV